MVLQLAGQNTFVELVEVDQLDQIGELGVPIIQSEECLPIILTRQDLEVFNLLVMAQCQYKRLWIALAVTKEEQPIHETLLLDDPVRFLTGDTSMKPMLSPVNH